MGNTVKVRADKLLAGDVMVDGEYAWPIIATAEGGDTALITYQGPSGSIYEREVPNDEMVEVGTR